MLKFEAKHVAAPFMMTGTRPAAFGEIGSSASAAVLRSTASVWS